jgi:hypothetical protein
MNEVPRWISSRKVETVRTLLSEDPVRVCARTDCPFEGAFLSFYVASTLVCAGDAVRTLRSNTHPAVHTNSVLVCACAYSLRETLGVRASPDSKSHTQAFCLHPLPPRVQISADGSEKLLRNDDVELFEERDGQQLVWVDRDHRLNVAHFFVAVDPSGGGPSAFSICSLVVMRTGFMQVCPPPRRPLHWWALEWRVARRPRAR